MRGKGRAVGPQTAPSIMSRVEATNSRGVGNATTLRVSRSDRLEGTTGWDFEGMKGMSYTSSVVADSRWDPAGWLVEAVGDPSHHRSR